MMTSNTISEAVVHGIASVQPKKSYSQLEVERLLGLNHPLVSRFIRASHIHKRHLILPEPDRDTGAIREETSAELHKKFKQFSVELSKEAIVKAAHSAKIDLNEIRMLIAVTSTGFLVPGLSSRLIQELELRQDIQKMDIVGMGCNAAVAALIPLSAWLKANPNYFGLLVCCEVNSAAYELDQSVRTGIVNSLFGDNVSAVIIGPAKHEDVTRGISPQFLNFESHILPEHLSAMQFVYVDDKKKMSFSLSKDIPFVVGENARIPVERLLQKNGISRKDVSHWIVHTGGAAVIDGVKKSLYLSEYDVRHTRSVLHDYGNVSSGSVLLSLERLQAEGKVRKGELGVILAMGPGASIDAGLMQWQ